MAELVKYIALLVKQEIKEDRLDDFSENPELHSPPPPRFGNIYSASEILMSSCTG